MISAVARGEQTSRGCWIPGRWAPARHFVTLIPPVASQLFLRAMQMPHLQIQYERLQPSASTRENHLAEKGSGGEESSPIYFPLSRFKGSRRIVVRMRVSTRYIREPRYIVRLPA